MSAPGRSQALIPEPFKGEGTPVSAPGRSQALIPEPFKGEGTPVSAPGRSQALIPEPSKGEGIPVNAAPLLALQGLQTYYGETQVLFGPTLHVRPGEVLALLGPSGAGKTTTLRSILGLTPARRGSVHFDGRDITHEATHRIAAGGVGWVPDDRRVFPALTVARNLEIARKKTRFRAWSLGECFALFSALEYLMQRECENLSGGEMQMVAIARVLMGAPGLVLMDEPSQGLAPKVVQDVMRAITRLRSEGVAVVLVEQNVASALAVADRVSVMQGGRIVHECAAAELRDDAAARRHWLGA
jgi:branched-chain amino acid transport system ATP-binding protein